MCMNIRKLAICFSIYSYLLCLFALLLSNIYEIGFDLSYGWLYPIMPCFLLYYIVCRLKRWAWIPVLIVLLLLFGEIFTLYFYYTPYSIHVVQLLINTNMQESQGFIREAVLSKPLLYTMLSMCSIGVIAYGVMFAAQQIKYYWKYAIYPILALVITSAVLLSFSYHTLYERFQEEDVTYFVLHRDDKPCYFTPLTRLLNGIAYAHASSFLEEKVKKHLLEAQVETCSFDSPLIVMVIGESYDKYHTPLYNSNYRNTTPFLCNLRDKDSLLVYNDVVAPFNLTNELFHALFSTCPYDSLGRWYDYPLFPAVFKKAGYKVSFLSNQFALHNSDIWNHYTGNIFYNHEMSALQFDYHNSEVYAYDKQLLTLLPDTSALTSSPHLLIIHLMGQHVSYEQRYPSEYSFYTVENTETMFGGYTGKKIVAEYDNSLRYNDDVIRQVIEYIKPLDAVLLYFSDHGEECYDWRDAFMRTSESPIPKEVAKYQYETPFLVFMTEQYTIKHPDLSGDLKAAIHQPIYNSDMSNVLFHLAGIKTSTYYPNRDFLSPLYDPTIPRVLRFEVDYNELMK